MRYLSLWLIYTTLAPAADVETISFDFHAAAEWIALSHAETHSAVRILRAVDPETKQAYLPGKQAIGCDVAALQRSFRLTQSEMLVGEPLIVSFVVALQGAGTWREGFGGNYRLRGRDDNFAFALRRSDGTWVADPYGWITSGMAGGMGGLDPVTQVKQSKRHMAVWQYVEPPSPGTYELYCVRYANSMAAYIGENEARLAALPKLERQRHVWEKHQLIDKQTGAVSKRFRLSPTWRGVQHGELVSPLAARYPEVAAKLGLSQATDVARFTLTVRAAKQGEDQRMVKAWMQRLEDARGGMPTAIRLAMVNQRGNAFLPIFEPWLVGKHVYRHEALRALSLRSSKASLAMFMKQPATPEVLHALYFVQDHAAMRQLLPMLIGALTHADIQVRSDALRWLCNWTDQSLGKDWDGYTSDRPSVEEAGGIQQTWRRWYKEHGATAALTSMRERLEKREAAIKQRLEDLKMQRK